jgi:serine/threonine protein kinase
MVRHMQFSIMNRVQFSVSIDTSFSSPCITSDRYSDIYSAYDVSGIILGTGTYGTVRECTHCSTGKKYAVKTINKSIVSRHDVKREVELLQSIDHPNIIKMNDCFEDEVYVHIITERFTGGELLDLILDNTTDYGCLSEEYAASVIKSLLESVQYLHSKDIVHRDIKPENLLLSTNDDKAVVKLIDFGFSRTHNDGYMTNKVGSPYYMSPCILQGKYDKSCDLWAVGIVTYILLSGYPPFNGDNDNEVKAAIMKGDLVFEHKVWGHLSEICRNFVLRLLCMDETSAIVTASEALRHPWLNKSSKQATV